MVILKTLQVQWLCRGCAFQIRIGALWGIFWSKANMSNQPSAPEASNYGYDQPPKYSETVQSNAG